MDGKKSAMDFRSIHASSAEYGSELGSEVASSRADSPKRRRPSLPIPTRIDKSALIYGASKSGPPKSTGMNAYEAHVHFVNNYMRFYKGPVPSSSSSSTPSAIIRSDIDTLKENHRFIRTAADDASDRWESRLAKKYYDRLFKEYVIADISRYKEGKVGFRWRTEKEVVSGKGQFSCGNKKCEESNALQTYEVNFVYEEAGERKQALVKIRLCPTCGFRLHYKRNKEKKHEAKRIQKQQEKEAKRIAKERARMDPETLKLLEKYHEAQQRLEELKGEEGEGAAEEEGLRKRKLDSKSREAEQEEEEEDDYSDVSSEFDEEELKEQQAIAKAKESQMWRQKPQLEKSKEEEMEDYLEELFMQ